MYRCWKSQQFDLKQLLRGRSRKSRLKILFSLSFAIVFLLGGLTTAPSQDNSETLIIAPTLMTITSAKETGLPVRVITPHQNAFVLIEGLPKAIALSTGRLFDSGIWAVKVSELDELKIVAMVNTIENHNLLFTLKTLEGNVLAELKTVLRISPVLVSEAVEAELDREVQTAAVASSEPHETRTRAGTVRADRLSAVAPEPPILSEEDMEIILLLMRKGSENMKQGKINIARLFYTRAADKGWADAAFSLARTYDEAELEEIGAIGVQPDPELAAKWYERAVELGSKTALAYLERFQ